MQSLSLVILNDPHFVTLNSSSVMLSEAKHLNCLLRINSVKDID